MRFFVFLSIVCLSEIPLPVFSEGYTPVISQPSTNNDDYPGSRRPIPVSVIDLETSQTSCFSPLHGLDFLRGSSSFIIQQTVELSNLLRDQGENRFNIKVPRGATIYSASESSEGCERGCFGSSRSFVMSIYDPSQQKVMEFRRRLACGGFNFCFYLQKMEVWAETNEYIGSIEQNMSFMETSFSILDRNGNVQYNIKGPDSCCCLLSKNQSFCIYNIDCSTQVGTIIHQWDQLAHDYNIHVQGPDFHTSTRNKALILGAAFLLEYMYFESVKRTSCRCIC
ncbi:phospholipid scramblase 1-like [Aethina tumida]|uniref:phospholipid scramblase 1-like n=1 Tax=Aethina tumida TaxID=116153 RepID=UPI00214922A4|nr:phospholipid scramblase 1-like [Aethina tumida]